MQHDSLPFSFNSDDGLGTLYRFPKEIRNMIYGFVVPLVTALTHDDNPAIDDDLVRALMAFPLLRTSKQLCVEFLGIYIRSIELEEIIQLVYSCQARHSLEALLAHVGRRIHVIPQPKELGCRTETDYFYINMWLCTVELEVDLMFLLPRQIKRLWTLHEKYSVTSDKLYIEMTYYEPAELIASLDSTSRTVRSSTLTHLFYTNTGFRNSTLLLPKFSNPAEALLLKQ